MLQFCNLVGRVIETKTIQKNGMCPKSLITSRKNFLKKICFALLSAGIVISGCKKDEETTPAITSIAVTTQPVKKDYIVGENFDPAGMVVTATYSDKSTAPVTVTNEMLDYDFSTAGTNKTVTVTYHGETATVTGITVIVPDTRSSYFATWASEGGTSLTFSNNEVIWAYIISGVVYSWAKVSPITWTAVTNTNSVTKNDYPAGYNIAGLVSEKDDLWAVPIGDPFGEGYSFYIHTDGNSIIEQRDDNSLYDVMARYSGN